MALANDHVKEVVPHLRFSCFWEVHAGATSGHFGLSNTIHTMKQKYFWANIAEDIEQWYNECKFCTSHKEKQGLITKVPMTPIVAKEPWEVVGLDVVPFKTP